MRQVFLPLMATAAIITAIGISSGKIQKQTQSQKKEVKIGTATIDIEIADSSEERAKGLSNRSILGENEGMLFVFEKDNVYPSFWMKDMLIPIDIIWINDGKVAKIHKNVQPEPQESSLTLYRPDTPIDYVLEVNAGFSDKNALKVGDSLSGI